MRLARDLLLLASLTILIGAITLVARRPVLGGFDLNLFGGGGVDASVFSIASQSKQNEAYLALTRVEVQWEAGKVSDDDYLAALGTYVQTFPADSAERLNQQSRLESTTYRIQRNVLVAKVNAGQKSLTDLLNYDKSKLQGLNPDSQEYLDRQGRLFDTQQRVFTDEEEAVVERYSDGKMTTTQLKAWYEQRASDPRYAGNVELKDAIDKRVGDLADRVVDERDAKVISDYSAGKMAPTKFLAYATKARARYEKGTQQADEWDSRLESAKDAVIEDDLAYRYSLSQEYLQLKQFVQGNSAAPKGSSGYNTTRTTSRTILGADGQWHTVKQTQTTHHAGSGPSAAEQQAYRNRQIEVSEAKRRMATIENKIGKLQGAWVTTEDMLRYYTRQSGRVAKGSSEWYSIQSRIDDLRQQQSSERVLARQGIKLSYKTVPTSGKEHFNVPGAPSSSGTSGGSSSKPSSSIKKASAQSGNVSLDAFMAGIAKVESGGRYDARNSSTGAYGKYQILPSNWSAWAAKAGLPAGAKPTPENQEKVARNRFQHLWSKYGGDTQAMAAEWFAGAAGSKGGPSAWGPNTRRYVQKVMAAAGSSFNPGRTPGSGSSGLSSYATGGSGSVGGEGATSTGPRTSSSGGARDGKPSIRVVTGFGVHYADERGGIHEDRPEPRVGKRTTQTQEVNLPRGMTAQQFRQLYDGIEWAFKQGQEAAVIDLGNGQKMQVYIGDDPDEMLATMRELDDLRVDLAKHEVKAYDGTGTGVQVAQRLVAARKDRAEHELMLLNGGGNVKQGLKHAPVTSALRILDGVVDGVATEVQLMNNAWKRGDITEAYLHAQKIRDLSGDLELNGQKVGSLHDLAGLVAQAEQRIGQLQAKYGVKVPAALQKDLDRLNNFQQEIAEAAEGGVDTVTEMDNVIQKDPDGQVTWTGGAHGGVKLKAGFIQTVDKSGKVKVEPTATGVRKDGTQGPLPPDDMVPVVIKAGASKITAYSKYDVAQVGMVKLADGTIVPLMGKQVTVASDRNQDGVPDGTTTYFENPLSPGRWSNVPILYNAPAGTKAVVGQDGKTQGLQFTGADGTVVSLNPDAKTGTYQVWGQKPGTGILGGGQGVGASDPEIIGTAGDQLTKDLLKGWERDTSNTSPMNALQDTATPALGWTSDEWAEDTLTGSVNALRDFAAKAAKTWAPKPPALTRESLSARAANSPSEATKRSNMAVNADLARELLDRDRGREPTRANPGAVSLKGPVVLSKLPTQNLPNPNSNANANRDLRRLDDRASGANRPTGTTSSLGGNGKTVKKTTVKKSTAPKRTSMTSTARNDARHSSSPAPRKKAVVKKLPTRTTTTVQRNRNTAF